MKLYHNPLSPNSRRALIVAQHLKLDLEEVIVDLTKGGTRTPEFLQLNPSGMVPVLVDGDFVLTESRVIAEYLAAKRPESGLWPADEKERFDVNRWMMWDAAHFSSPIGTLTFEKLLKPMLGSGETDEGRVRDALTTFDRFARVLEQRLTGKDYIVGGRLTVADLAIACALTYTAALGVSLEPYPNLRSWFSRIRELPAWKSSEPNLAG